MKLIDFQVHLRPTSLVDEDQSRRTSDALFVVYEPLRLWLKQQKVAAPFRKIAVTLMGDAGAPMHGLVMNALSVCEVIEAVDLSELRGNVSDHEWVLGIVSHALDRIQLKQGWESPELARYIATLAESPQPLVHFFEELAQVDKKTGLKCVPWFSTRLGECRVGVRIGERDVTIRSSPDPIFLEDDFPLAKLAIRGREVVLLDKSKAALAAVPIEV